MKPIQAKETKRSTNCILRISLLNQILIMMMKMKIVQIPSLANIQIIIITKNQRENIFKIKKKELININNNLIKKIILMMIMMKKNKKILD